MTKNRIIGIGVVVLIVGGIVALLLRNKAASEAKSHSEVLTSPAVTVASVATEVLGDTLSLVGSTVANSDVNVVAEGAGRIVAVYVKQGEHVAAGDVLFQLDSVLQFAAVQTAEANDDKARKDLERYEWLKKQKTVGDAQVEAAALGVKQADAALVVARRQLSNTRIKTPIAGVVSARLFDFGAYIQEGTVVANVVDVSSLKVRLSVAEGDAFRVHAGDNVAIATAVYPGVVFSGTIANISAKGDEAHTYPMEISLQNNGAHPLRAGMFVRVLFTSLPHTQSLTVPRAALVGSIRAPQVFVVESNVAHLRDVTVNSVSDTRLAISKGLAQGESVVVAGQNNVKEGTIVTVVK